MRTSQGKLAVLGFVLLLAFALLLPMRAGQEDMLRVEPGLLRMCVGDSYRLSSSLSAENMVQGIRYASSDEQVAVVDRDGTVLGLRPGEAEIRAVATGGASASMRVEVVGVPLTRLELNVDELRIEKGEYSGLSVSYNEDATDARLRWVSSDEAVVRVDDSGKVYGAGGGTAFVSVVSPTGMSASAKVYVRVRGTAVHISPDQLTLGVGARVPMKVSYLPLDCTDGVERWVSSDPGVAGVGEDGVLEARGVGSAYVTVVTGDGLTAGMEVRVESAPSEIQLDPARATLERGDTLPLQLKFLEEDGSVEENVDHLVVWSSSDPSVASVDEAGLVTARRSGSCAITASADGMSATCELNVQVSIQEIRLNRSEVYLLREDTDRSIQLDYVYAPVDPDDPTVTFSSNNEQVATVSKYGLVELTGGYGTAIITARANSGAQAQFVVNVVTQLPDEGELYSGAEATATAPPANAAPYEEMYRQMQAGGDAETDAAQAPTEAPGGADGYVPFDPDSDDPWQ